MKHGLELEPDILRKYSEIASVSVAWMPAQTPPTTFFVCEVRSGLDPLE